MEISERVKNYRNRCGMSQDKLAQESGLNLRTIQRIEKGETVPRGDSLRRLSIALETSPDELIDWQAKDDKNVLAVLNLSQLSFLAFPILGILLPLIIWILQKDKVRKADKLGKLILNFQISWTMVFFIPIGLIMIARIKHIELGFGLSEVKYGIFIMYAYNVLIIIFNSVFSFLDKRLFYIPAFRFLK